MYQLRKIRLALYVSSKRLMVAISLFAAMLIALGQPLNGQEQNPGQPVPNFVQPVPNQFGNGFGAGGVNLQGGQSGLQVFGFGQQFGVPMQGIPLQQAQQLADQLMRGLPLQIQQGNFGFGQVNLNGQNGNINAGGLGLGGQQIPLNPGIPAQVPQQQPQNALNPQQILNPANPQVPLNPAQVNQPAQPGNNANNQGQSQTGQISTVGVSQLREFIKQRADEVFGTKTASANSGIGQAGMQQQLNDLRDEIKNADGLPGAVPGDNVATFMGIEAEGKNICIIADCSGSMAWGVKLPFVKQQILETVKALNADQRFQVVFFHTGAIPYPRFGWRHPQQDLKTLEIWLSQVIPLGGTLPTPAFNYVYSNLNPRPDAIFFLTDGEFPQPVAPYIERLNSQAKIPIHTICYYSLAGERIMRLIASQSGGKFLAVGVNNQPPMPAPAKAP